MDCTNREIKGEIGHIYDQSKYNWEYIGLTVVILNNLCLFTWIWMSCMVIAMINLYNLRLFAYIYMSCMVIAQRQAVTWLWKGNCELK